jgi:TRAP-type mannitol/chloroaromatic compound transport system substrate-binding protein
VQAHSATSPREAAAKNPNFRRVYASYAKFRADYAIWREHGYLK